MKRNFFILLIAATVILGELWYVHWSKTRAMNSGDVYVLDQPGDAAQPKTAKNQPAHPQEKSPETTASTPATPAGQAQEEASVTAPSDTISRNPPNRVLIAGTGKYALYRQGDITWRLNTDTGQACIIFATETQWRKMLVYQHGCGSH
jgi:hypothetical protein